MDSRWLDLRREVEACTRCGLDVARTQVVFGAGSIEADLVFVGEAPGANEDLEGEPFVGQAGRLLTRLLEGIGLRREDVFIANILKCRPPENRNPTPHEVECCRPFLMRQLELLEPRVVGALGTFAAQTLLGTRTPIGKLRDKPIQQVGSYFLVPMYHPAAALHNPRLSEEVERDFLRLKEFLERDVQPAPQAEQMDLF
jgi:DNA polymerase